ncbi:F-box domain protein [Cordyceps fumosorosea ARSEF 2679]|uniref:F-box domain protein n=1 Tax=Cordyceps fumosorosea (strain ARSEF 2679) TaxID=1081104 RepID=A0A162I9X6_CORFA|nr:F-box domain protein [Cordyceps fumosorosea ARSEF 2679]OAA54195.1 F-box domain protein [Cordyceps fumosorosea ARSEF 2679]
MRLPFRKKEKKGSLQLDVPPEFRPAGAGQLPRFPPTARSAHALAQLPATVLARIFAYVCPHAGDETFDTCEESARDDNCVLCDLRDLSHCAKVSRAWRAMAIKVLYHSVRIEPVHYCKMEAWLAERRKKTGRFDRNGVPEDTAQVRLRLLRRTVRDDPTRIGCLVQYLKIPYMLREFCYVELAQTIAVLPDLHYVDLPEGMFADDPAYATLRLEVQARCSKLRKMTYVAGAERSFAALATGQVWPRLQVLELNRLNVDPATMRNVLGCLVNLRALKVSQTDSLSDEVLLSAEGLPALPPLEELVLKDTPRVTAAGLVEYLAWLETQQALKVLTLKDTGVQPAQLTDVLTMATSLRTLALQTKVSEPLPHGGSGLAPLASQSLRTLRFEVSGRTSSAQDASAANSHYAYLAQSILSGDLPRLRKLYVHDESFPDKLQSALPAPGGVFTGGGGPRHRQQSSSLSSTRGAPPALRVSPGGSPPGAGAGNGLASPKFSGPMASPVGSPRGVPRSLGTAAAGQAASQNRLSSNNPFAPPPQQAARRAPIQTLEIFIKSDEFGQWNFARVDTIHSRRSPQPGGGGGGGGGGGARPESHYGLAADIQGHDWDNGGSRRSVLVGNAEGGFLALPGPVPFAPPPDLPALANDDYRPRSSGGLSFSRLRR